MAFYLRKSFKAGPVRLNLSKRGLGTSVGIKGLRVGKGPRGSYVHGGRKGLYYRKSLSSSKKSTSRTGQSYGGGVGFLGIIKIIGVLLAFVVIINIINWFAANPQIFFAIVGVFAVVLGFVLYRKFRVSRALSQYKSFLDTYFVLQNEPFQKAVLEELTSFISLLQKKDKARVQVAEIEKNAYDALFDKILDDKQITQDERVLIDACESITSIDGHYKKETKKDIFRLYYLDAIADHEITNSEVQTLKNIITGLKLKQDDIKAEIETVNEIIRMQKLRLPLTPISDVPVRLPQSDTAYYSGSAKVLSRRKAPKSSPNEYECSVKRDGKLIVTNRRLIVVGDGTTSVNLKDILDIDIDLDKKFIMLSKQTSSTPTFIQTREPLVVGKLIDLLNENDNREQELNQS